MPSGEIDGFANCGSAKNSSTAVGTLQQANDIVRYEIATALEKRLLVIPLLWGRTAPPASKTLPPELRRLPDLQVAVVDQRLRRRDLEQIAVRLRSAGLR